MPLTPGHSQETISSNIAETLESPTFAAGKPRKKKREMAIAAAYSSARKSRKRTGLSTEALRKKRKNLTHKKGRG